jgi:hypothetical protein
MSLAPKELRCGWAPGCSPSLPPIFDDLLAFDGQAFWGHCSRLPDHDIAGLCAAALGAFEHSRTADAPDNAGRF